MTHEKLRRIRARAERYWRLAWEIDRDDPRRAEVIRRFRKAEAEETAALQKLFPGINWDAPPELL